MDDRNYNIVDIRSRQIVGTLEQASFLLQGFADDSPILWPINLWPRDKFDSPLQVGAIGGHGATKYVVVSYDPKKELVFKFISPKGYIGMHGFTLETISIQGKQGVIITHVTKLLLKRYHLTMWYLAIKWVHEALIEDCFNNAELYLTGKIIKKTQWKWRVYFWRHILGGTRLIFDVLSH